MQTFLRLNYSDLWITLSSNEALGILDSDYIEDYFGVQGQISLRNVTSGVRVPVLMNELTSETLEIAQDVFSGVVPLASLADGLYEIEGRVRDVVGNFLILTQVQNPYGTETVLLLQLFIDEAFSGVIVFIGPFNLSGGFSVPVEIKNELLMTPSISVDTVFISSEVNEALVSAELLEDIVMVSPIVDSVSLEVGGL